MENQTQTEAKGGLEFYRKGYLHYLEMCEDLLKQINEEKAKNYIINEPIKHFDTGVVSYSLFNDFYHIFVLKLLNSLEFLTDSGFASEEDEMLIAMEMIEKTVKDAKSNMDEIFEKAKVESNEAGGNDIYTISMNETLKLKKTFVERQKAKESTKTAA